MSPTESLKGIVFEDEGAGKLIKKMSGYHQFHAVNVAVEETLRAAKSHKAMGYVRNERIWLPLGIRAA